MPRAIRTPRFLRIANQSDEPSRGIDPSLGRMRVTVVHALRPFEPLGRSGTGTVPFLAVIAASPFIGVVLCCVSVVSVPLLYWCGLS